MPLSINVGLSRKASENFQSLGTSINIAAELDQQLLAHPDQLQRSIDFLYEQARAALDRQAGTPAAPPAPATHAPPANGHNARPDNNRFNGNGNGNSSGPKPMSDKQRAAILAIAKRADVDAFASAKQTFGVDLGQLTGWQASKLIDSLKA